MRSPAACFTNAVIVAQAAAEPPQSPAGAAVPTMCWPSPGQLIMFGHCLVYVKCLDPYAVGEASFRSQAS